MEYVNDGNNSGGLKLKHMGLLQQMLHTMENKYRLKREEKNKSHEEIFYQMKVFFV